MDIESLRIFCHVMEEGSITQTARMAYISQPAVTKRIRQLEEHYGALLFNRIDNRLVPTEAGEKLYPYAIEMVGNYQRSREEINELKGLLDRYLNIGASLTIGEYILPRRLVDFTKKHSNLKFNLVIGNTPEILAKLKTNKIDIALVEGGIIEKQGLMIEKMAEDELVLITHKDHQWQDFIDIKELEKERFILRERQSGTRLIVEEALKEHGIYEGIQQFMELGSMEAIKNAVQAGLGISIVPKIIVENELKFGVLKEVKVRNFRLIRDLKVVQKKVRFQKKGLIDFVSFITG